MLLKSAVNHNLNSYSHIGRKDAFKFFFRLRHKLKNSEKAAPKTSAEVINFLENSPEYTELKDVVPKHLLRKYKTPESMYLINKKTAKETATTLRSFLERTSPVLEVNPGFGFLSEELLQYVNHLYTYESSNSFSQFRNDLEKKYPGKTTCKSGDFFALWKLAFQDKMDNGTRLKDFLGDLSTDDNDRVVKIVGAMPGLSFVKHLLNTIIFHSGSNHLGRPDLYITMPVNHYEYLTDSQVSSTKHKSLPSLFQLLFDYEIISKIPKVHYLPWIHAPEVKKLSPISEHYVYLAQITQKAQLPCSSSHLPLLWYFFKPHMLSKTTRVIPMLEQWIPGCGVWLITGQDPPDTRRHLAPHAGDAPLPHVTIFTEFGDLDLRQKVTVFKRFISWPEFEQCPFRVTMENNLPKFVSAVDMDDKDNITHIDDMDDKDNITHIDDMDDKDNITHIDDMDDKDNITHIDDMDAGPDTEH